MQKEKQTSKLNLTLLLNRFFLLFFVSTFLLSTGIKAQNCSLKLTGTIVDKRDNPITFVNVYALESGVGVVTKGDGIFLFENLCPGPCHIQISHLNYDTEVIHLNLDRDSTIQIKLQLTNNTIETITIEDERSGLNNQSNVSINRQIIEDNSYKNVSALIERETGVHLIKNGSGISKPVVHGLYGNRLIIMNNGVAQSGQQWGNDHSPEIDPFTADRVSVIKGANAIEHGGGNFGGIVLIEPSKISPAANYKGQVNYSYESNGRGNNLNARLEDYNSSFAWRANVTLKKYGDRHTPDYFLNNTGLQERNFSFQLEKSWNNNLFLDYYLSSFNTELGVLRGSHIGNLTDLNDALSSDVPFFTEEVYADSLEAPKQDVSHHLAKLRAKYFITEDKVLEFVIAGQINDRKEFDIRRGGRTTTASLSLTQYTLNTDFSYTYKTKKNWRIKLGNQNIFTDNNNNPGTGILPLIPNYRSWKSGIFATAKRTYSKIDLNIGFRYDFEQQRAATISASVPREIIRYKNNYHNLSGALGLEYTIAGNQSLLFNTGYAMRNPAINELYSAGLHQGVSGIEEGSLDLQTESSLKTTVEHKWKVKKSIRFSTLCYFQRINDYIFLNPQNETRLTIRGSFPVFQYEQTDARIYGLDFTADIDISSSFSTYAKMSYIKGDDLSQNVPLVFLPSNTILTGLNYTLNKEIKIASDFSIENVEFGVSNYVVLNQGHLLDEQDFAPPPPTYSLLGIQTKANIKAGKFSFRVFVNIENALNERYRNYLNRQRYFADDLGRSITTGLSFKF